MAYTVPQEPGGHMTPKSTKLSGPGGYTTNTPTKSGGAGALKPMGGGQQSKVHRSAVSPFSGGRRGQDVKLRGDRKIIASVPDVE